VRAGQLIGTSGNTGASRGPHLHLSLWIRGVPVQPLSFSERTARPSLAGPSRVSSRIIHTFHNSLRPFRANRIAWALVSRLGSGVGPCSERRGLRRRGSGRSRTLR
jgi:hypothetical protein